MVKKKIKLEASFKYEKFAELIIDNTSSKFKDILKGKDRTSTIPFSTSGYTLSGVYNNRYDFPLRKYPYHMANGAICRVVAIKDGKIQQIINGTIIGLRHVLTHESIFNNKECTFLIEYHSLDDDQPICYERKANIVGVFRHISGLAIAILDYCAGLQIRMGIGLLEYTYNVVLEHGYFSKKNKRNEKCIYC